MSIVSSAHLVVCQVICALVSLKHVVTPQFLVDMVSACQAKTKLPDPNE